MEFDPEVAPDGIDWFQARGETPAIVSISDIHGYLDAARAALTAIEATDSYAPVVVPDDDGRLHWADNDYILLVNGDLIDRGPQNRECLDLLCRLADEAPPGRVRYHLGNHEMAVLFPERFPWPGTFSIELDRDLRRRFIQRVATGAITAAFEGYRYTYSHAGRNEPFAASSANEEARRAARELLAAMDEGNYDDVQRDVIERHELVFGVGGAGGRGPSAGLLWMDFEHMRPEAPPQIVGHSRQPQPTRSARVVCENVIRSNRHSPGGEAVLIEREGSIEAIINQPDSVDVWTL